MLSVNVVERFDDRMAELLFNISALGHAVFNWIDSAVALLEIATASVDDHHTMIHSF